MSAGEITRLLQDADRGDAAAAGRLFALVQDDLKAIARRRLRSAPAGADVSPTMLADDAFCRLVGAGHTAWAPGDRYKFFGYASAKIHDLLIDAVRAERAAKRGGGHVRADDYDVAGVAAGDGGGDDLPMLLDLRAALDRFEAFARDDAIVFRVRFFLGCTFDEVAALTGTSATEAKRAFTRARLWLQRELKEYALEP